TDPSVLYQARGDGYSLYLTEQQAVLHLTQSAQAGGQDAVLRMSLVGGNSAPAVVGLDQQIGRSNYFIGNDPSQWHTDIPRFDRVEYQQVYAGIDVVYYGNDQHQLEYDFIVAPGANTDAIALHFDGAAGLTIDGQGDLVLHLQGGDVVQHAPVVYQDVGG